MNITEFALLSAWIAVLVLGRFQRYRDRTKPAPQASPVAGHPFRTASAQHLPPPVVKPLYVVPDGPPTPPLPPIPPLPALPSVPTLQPWPKMHAIEVQGPEPPASPLLVAGAFGLATGAMIGLAWVTRRRR